MSLASKEIPVAIDYTSRDFYSLKADLIERIKSNVNVPGTGINWTGNDPADFGVAMVEAFAYLGDIVNYYIDRIANENYLGTATQRQSIIDLAKTYGYIPSGYQAATVPLRFYNASGNDVTVPSGTQVSGQLVVNDVVSEVVFTTQEDVTVPAAVDDTLGQADTGTAVHGELASTQEGNDTVYGELVGVSDGTPGQSFTLSQNQVVENSIKVYVEVGNGSDYTQWQQATHLEDMGPSDAAYLVDTDADNFVTIIFGDGISGAIPNSSASIKINYYIGGGAIGNVNAGTINTIKRTTPGVDLSNIEVSNIASGSGGSDPESNNSIRINAPKSIRALNRAVTLNDYANLALTVPNVGKANAVGDTKNSITVYVGPQQSSTLTDLYPGYTDDPSAGGVLNASWPLLSESVYSYLSDKIQVGVSVTISPPTYVPVYLTLNYTKMEQYSSAQVKSAIMLALINAFSYTNLGFGDRITPEEVEYQVRQAPGVFNASVIGLNTNSSPGRHTIVAGPGQIFVFDEANLYVNANSADATLSALTISAGTLAPVFSSSQYNYNVTVPNGTTSVDVTPTKSTAVISVNNTYVSSGSASTITTAVGVTTAIVNVTAQDGVTTSSYRVTITRAS